MFGSGLLTIVVVALLVRRFWRRDRADDLPGLLASAEDAGIISADQRQRLIAHAAARPGSPRLGAVWLAIVAGLFIVAGVSLLIARNWELIGPTVRVGAFALALLGAGEAAIRSRGRAAALAVPLELLWFLLPLLGIGLYGQTFQLAGDPIRPYLVWLALTAPLAWLSPRPVVAVTHTAAMVVVLFAGNFLSEFGLTPGASPASVLTLVDGTPALAAWGLSGLLLAAIAAQSLLVLPRHHRHHFLGVVAVWLFVLLVVCRPLRLEDPAWLTLAAIALATAWLALNATLDVSPAEWRPSLTAWLGSAWGLTFYWHASKAARDDATGGGIAVALLATAAAGAAVTMLTPARLSPDRSWARGAQVALLVPLAAAALLLTADVRVWWTVAVLMNLFLAAVAVGLMWHGALARESAQINLGVAVLVALLLTRFLDVFGSMLQSGIGLIVAGIVLAGLAYALEHTRRRLVRLPHGDAA